MEKASLSKAMISSKIAQELELAKYRIAENSYILIFLTLISINLRKTLFLPAAFLLNFLFPL